MRLQMQDQIIKVQQPYERMGDCYVQVERSARLEQEGCDQDVQLIDDGASALGTL